MSTHNIPRLVLYHGTSNMEPEIDNREGFGGRQIGLASLSWTVRCRLPFERQRSLAQQSCSRCGLIGFRDLLKFL
jgi:hypothetical protein